MLALNRAVIRATLRSSIPARNNPSSSVLLNRSFRHPARIISSSNLSRTATPFFANSTLTTSACQLRLRPTMTSDRPVAPVGSRKLATVAAVTGVGHPSVPFPLESLPTGYQIYDNVAGVKTSAPYAVFTKDIELPTRDDMKYRLIRLANGLEALVIHDQHTDKSSAAMDIRVGHLSDPEQLQGLAHFCEHLLFMGTKKYPRENEYSEFLSNHSGGSNAYTGMDNTNYFFDVSPDHLEEALDRFAQFFLEPLFDPSCSEREIRAVDSEHKKNLQSDMWRSFQLEKSLSDPTHPFSHFGTGNYQTLWENPKSKGLDVRDELLKFHDQYYSANVMKLVVLGKESLDQLTSLVIEKFSGVRNTGREPPSFPRSPLQSEQLKKQIFCRSVKDVRKLKLTFPIPDQGLHFRSKPAMFLSHFIGHEGPGSILSHLKKKGWCDRLSAGATDGAHGFEFFKISVDLTEEGFKNYDQVLESIFKYIHLLKNSKFQEWTHQEVAQLSELMFRFKEKIDPADYASSIATQMQMSYPREWILSGAYLTRDFDLSLIQQTLDKFDPSNCRVLVMAKTLPDGSTTWESNEKWYGTEHTISPLPDKLLNFNATDLQDLSLPKPNSFIPNNFDLKGSVAADQGKKPTPRPQLISNNSALRVWHKLDDRFGLPKANAFIVMRNPLVNASPNASIKTRMLIELLADSLVEYSYDASLAGLSYSLDSQDHSLALSLSGYNDKIHVLAQSILKAFANFKVDPKRFELVRDRVRRSYLNFDIEEPFRHANYYATYLLQDKVWTPKEKLAELEQLTADQIQNFLPELLQRLHLEVLAHGNMGKQEATDLAQMALDTLKCRPVSPTELISMRSLILPPGTNHVWKLPVANKANVNSAIEYYVQVGDPDNVPLRATLSVLAQIANEPVFDQLRTKEQLGYLVFSGTRRSIGTMGWRILVQSERDADYLESRVDAFLDQFKKLLENLTEEEFQAHKASIIHKKLETVKNLYEESLRFWNTMFTGHYDFLSRYTDVEAITNVTKDEVVELFNKHVHPSSETRTKLSVHLQSNAKAVRFSVKATEALETAIKAQGLVVPEEAWTTLKEQQPSTETVKDLAQQTLSQAADVPTESLKQTMDLVDSLATQFPYEEKVDETQTAALTSTVTSAISPQPVQDPTLFKAQLTSSKAAVPVRTFEELAMDPEQEAEKVAEIAQALTNHLAKSSSKANL